MDAVVQLDALIDEKGNVAQTKPLSGPRVLQRAAGTSGGAVGDRTGTVGWEADLDAYVLTVQFQVGKSPNDVC